MDDTRDYARLFLNDTPLLDVRAPVEFAKGAFPTASNVPLLDDDERHRVGIRYKQQGQQAAIDLGNDLVSGRKKNLRLDAWRAWRQQHPDGYLYCFRGGLRSRTAQAWLSQAGVDVPLVVGGYKAMRRFLLDSMQRNLHQLPMVVLSGRTGCGKTRLIERLDNAVDLEGLAHHRGSTFGRRPAGQPAQIDFENRLSIALLKQAQRHDEPVVVEDEGKLIGRCYVPDDLQARIRQSPRVVIDEPLEARVQVTLEDYVTGPLDEYSRHYGEEQAFEQLAEALLAALDRIRKRLGGARHQFLRGELENALYEQRHGGDPQRHGVWIRELLSGYYDPMYDYMLQRRDGPILYQGRRAEVMEYLNHRG